MKLHILTIGTPKLAYAKVGFAEYTSRIDRLHQLRVTHLADKFSDDTDKLLQTAGNAYLVGLVIDGGQQFSSHELASFLQKRELEAREVCCIIGGPDGLPQSVRDKCDTLWSFSKLTFPHDLAMVILSEALYRASTINTNHPYHH